jgi:hypothetical protein
VGGAENEEIVEIAAKVMLYLLDDDDGLTVIVLLMGKRLRGEHRIPGLFGEDLPRIVFQAGQIGIDLGIGNRFGPGWRWSGGRPRANVRPRLDAAGQEGDGDED